MASLRNTLFMRMLEQQDAKRQRQLEQQQAGLGQVAASGRQFAEDALAQEQRDAALAQGLGAGAGVRGEAMPDIAEPRLQEYARVGYQPKLAEYEATQIEQQQANQKLSQAAFFQELREKYNADKLALGKEQADARLVSAEKIAQANRASMERIARGNQQVNRERLAAKGVGGMGGKVGVELTKDVAHSMGTLAALEELDKVPNPQQFLTVFGRTQVVGAAEANRWSAPRLANVMLSPQRQADAAKFENVYARLTSADAKALFGLTQTGREILLAAKALLNTTMSPQQFEATKQNLKILLRQHILATQQVATQGMPGSDDEISRQLDAVAQGGAGISTNPVASEITPEEQEEYNQYRDQGYSDSDARAALGWE